MLIFFAPVLESITVPSDSVIVPALRSILVPLSS